MKNKGHKISRVLIANRGEIACRVATSLKLMGIEAVTIFAENDRNLPHASAGDIALPLTGENLRETYLNGAQIIKLAKSVQADAIHPGYGFLSENADFSDAVTKAGLIFIGPSGKIMRRMGDKAGARKEMEKIGIPLIPGYHGDDQSESRLLKEAEKIGFPVLIKAAAGGGGKGMKIVERKQDFADQLKLAKSEAKSSFGDERVLVEKYLKKPRHVEVQVFSDTHGNHLHMFERDCSIQRRHQKILEESPAPNLPEKLRQKIHETATRITKHIGYVGAGTIECILDESGEFYFLEMNTRLQVEHPVTEMVTGLDLVALQVKIAGGGEIPFKQTDLKPRGHAIEARLYAEDAARGFLPATGKLEKLSVPNMPNVRVELGYNKGNDVTASYDPMIAKIIAWDETRTGAIRRLALALKQTVIQGVTTNREFLIHVLESDSFIKGDVSTDFLNRNKIASKSDDKIIPAAIAAFLTNAQSTAAQKDNKTENSAWASRAGFRLGAA